MMRKAALAVAVALALFFAVQPTSASAQDTSPCVTADAGGADTGDDDATSGGPGTVECAELAPDPGAALPDPGPFTELPASTTGPLGWGSLSITIAAVTNPGSAADTSDAAATGEAAGASPIAHTGTESFLLAYLGTGLVAFGAAALGARRRYFYADDR